MQARILLQQHCSSAWNGQCRLYSRCSYGGQHHQNESECMIHCNFCTDYCQIGLPIIIPVMCADRTVLLKDAIDHRTKGQLFIKSLYWLIASARTTLTGKMKWASIKNPAIEKRSERKTNKHKNNYSTKNTKIRNTELQWIYKSTIYSWIILL